MLHFSYFNRHWLRFITFVIFIFVNTCLSAQNFTIEQVLNSPFPTELTASPVGNKVAWVFNQQGSRNIWIGDETGSSPRQLTNYKGDNGQEISNLTFTPDGNTLIFVRGGAPNSAGEIPNPAHLHLQETVERAIFALDIDGKNLKKIATGFYPRPSPKGNVIAYLSGGQVWTVGLDSLQSSKLFQTRGTQSSIRWSPDGSKIAFVSTRGDHSFVGVYDFNSKSIGFLTPSNDLDGFPVWSPDSRQIGFVRVRTDHDALIFGPKREALPWSIWVGEVESGIARKVWEAKKGRGSHFFSNALNGSSPENPLFWTSDDYLIFPYEGDGWNHLYAISANGGEAKLLTAGNGEVEFVMLSTDKKSIIYNSNIGDIDRRHLWQVSMTSQPKQLTSGSGIEWGMTQSSNGTIFCLRSDTKMPARPAVLKDGILKDIATDLIPKEFPFSQLVEPQAIMITASDGMLIPCQLFLPKNHKAGEKHPATIFFHGGSRRQMLLGFNYGDYYHKAYALNQYLASQGYVVLSVNYRSGIGYGMEFREALHYGATGASEYNDVVGAGLYLKGREDVNSSKIGLWGGSYGGYLTALGLARASDLFACGVDIHGVHDWNTTTRNFIPSYDASKRVEWAKRAFESSPMNFLNTWKSPVLLIHADDDRNVPFAETVTLAEQLSHRNIYFEQLIFPDDVHSFLLHKNWVNCYRATTTFFDKFLKKQ
jgi:dipeptidyl aminopeptidase/acylaminoacyl peptidase